MSISPDTACVYSGSVMHRRMRDMRYRFQYRVFSLMLDIDRLDEAMSASALLSRNRFNLLGFYDRDHLPDGATGLRAWVEGVLSPAGIDGSRLRIRLLCMPRVLGMVFNPLSLWYCEHDDGQPAAVIAEVRNTFGERHCYLLRPDAASTAWPLKADHAKDFHVSPFIGMQASYRFRLERPGERLRIAIREFAEDELLLVATQHGVRRPLRSRVLAAELLRVPLQTVKVLAAIHWQALKIWLAGVRFHQKPSPPLEETS